MGLKFENIKVWNKALDMTSEIHELTRTFPKEEMYILCSQIKRAADSICLNIAEGSVGQSDKEFNRFMGFALRSAIEVVACLHIGKRRSLVDEKTFEKFNIKLVEIIKMIQAFRNKLVAKS